MDLEVSRPGAAPLKD